MQEKCWEHIARSEGKVEKPEQDPSFQEQLDAQQLDEQRSSTNVMPLQCNLNTIAVPIWKDILYNCLAQPKLHA